MPIHFFFVSFSSFSSVTITGTFSRTRSRIRSGEQSRAEPPMPSSIADLAELGKLFEEQRSRLLAMLQRRTDPALAVRLAPEDILGNAFLEARRKWEQFREQTKLSASAWLYC